MKYLKLFKESIDDDESEIKVGTILINSETDDEYKITYIEGDDGDKLFFYNEEDYIEEGSTLYHKCYIKGFENPLTQYLLDLKEKFENVYISQVSRSVGRCWQVKVYIDAAQLNGGEFLSNDKESKFQSDNFNSFMNKYTELMKLMGDLVLRLESDSWKIVGFQFDGYGSKIVCYECD